MILSNVILNGFLFQEGDLYIGNRCLVHIDGYFMIGSLHAYNTTEYCFKECKYYTKNEDGNYIPFVSNFNPFHWINRDDALIWEKSSPV